MLSKQTFIWILQGSITRSRSLNRKSIELNLSSWITCPMFLFNVFDLLKGQRIGFGTTNLKIELNVHFGYPYEQLI